jgi:hypothetical protein
MKCPHCTKSISFFSKELNRFGKVKVCPHCGGNVRVYVAPKSVALWFIPAVLLAILVRPVLGSWGTGLAVGLMVLVSLKLRPA